MITGLTADAAAAGAAVASTSTGAAHAPVLSSVRLSRVRNPLESFVSSSIAIPPDLRGCTANRQDSQRRCRVLADRRVAPGRHAVRFDASEIERSMERFNPGSSRKLHLRPAAIRYTRVLARQPGGRTVGPRRWRCVSERRVGARHGTTTTAPAAALRDRAGAVAASRIRRGADVAHLCRSPIPRGGHRDVVRHGVSRRRWVHTACTPAGAERMPRPQRASRARVRPRRVSTVSGRATSRSGLVGQTARHRMRGR